MAKTNKQSPLIDSVYIPNQLETIISSVLISHMSVMTRIMPPLEMDRTAKLMPRMMAHMIAHLMVVCMGMGVVMVMMVFMTMFATKFFWIPQCIYLLLNYYMCY